MPPVTPLSDTHTPRDLQHCDPYNDETLPEAPAELVNELSRRYIMLYEMITGLNFEVIDVHAWPARVQLTVSC